MIIDEDVYLAHHGVKGMKWGVRRQRRIDRISRAGQPGSTKASRARTLLSTTPTGPVDLVKGRGLRGGAARKATRIQSRTDRLAAGEGRVRDVLMHIGGTRLSDILPVKSKNIGKKTFMDNDKMVLAATGGLIAGRLLARVGTKKLAG
jgi:hypothetical protein